MTTPDERFEERLLSELRHVVAERPAPSVAPAPSSSSSPSRHAVRLTRSRLAIGATATVAATAVAAIVLAAGDTSTPAYAVEPTANGNVTVEINSLRDAAGLEHKLREAGIPAVVEYLPDGKSCRAPRTGTPGPAPGGPNERHSMSIELREGSVRFTIPRGSVRKGETLLITSSVGAGVSSVSTAIADGPLAPCELVDGPLIEAVPIPPSDADPATPATGAEGPTNDVAPERGTADDGPSTHVAPAPGGASSSGAAASGASSGGD